jgi:hypothetical protein
LSGDTLPQVSDESIHRGSTPDESAEGFDDVDDLDETQLDEAHDGLQEARRRLSEVPADVVVTNHVMGLYELAAIHLGASPPNLAEAALAIDAVACLVEGLGDRLGPESATMRDALANIRLAFVQIKNAAG